MEIRINLNFFTKNNTINPTIAMLFSRKALLCIYRTLKLVKKKLSFIAIFPISICSNKFNALEIDWPLRDSSTIPFIKQKLRLTVSVKSLQKEALVNFVNNHKTMKINRKWFIGLDLSRIEWKLPISLVHYLGNSDHFICTPTL